MWLVFSSFGSKELEWGGCRVGSGRGGGGGGGVQCPFSTVRLSINALSTGYNLSVCECVSVWHWL